MQRRRFMALLGGAATWPLVASTQPATMPVIGFLGGGSPETNANLVAEFRQGLAGESGYIKGLNVCIGCRFGGE